MRSYIRLKLCKKITFNIRSIITKFTSSLYTDILCDWRRIIRGATFIPFLYYYIPVMSCRCIFPDNLLSWLSFICNALFSIPGVPPSIYKIILMICLLENERKTLNYRVSTIPHEFNMSIFPVLYQTFAFSGVYFLITAPWKSVR